MSKTNTKKAFPCWDADRQAYWSKNWACWNSTFSSVKSGVTDVNFGICSSHQNLFILGPQGTRPSWGQWLQGCYLPWGGILPLGSLFLPQGLYDVKIFLMLKLSFLWYPPWTFFLKKFKTKTKQKASYFSLSCVIRSVIFYASLQLVLAQNPRKRVPFS